MVENIVTTDTAVATNALLKLINDDPNNFDCGKIFVDTDNNLIKYQLDPNDRSKDQIIAIFSDYAILQSSVSCGNDDKIDDSSRITIGVKVPQLPNKHFDITVDYIKRKDPSPTTLFEGVGNYAIAVAGANNATRGDNYDNAIETAKWIKNEPGNTESPFYSNIKEYLKDKKNITDADITNMTCSNLDLQWGYIKKAIFSYYAPGVKKILIINPHNNLNNIEDDFVIIDPKNQASAYLDVTYDIENGSGSSNGWYCVSFIGAEKRPQPAWTLTAVYAKNSNSPKTYTKLVLDPKVLYGNGTTSHTININSDYPLTGNFQLIGTILGGGINGWPHDEGDNRPWETDDIAEAILNDGTSKQLIEDQSNNLFIGRSATDFACDIFNTENNAGNLRGGELDIFNENIPANYFGGKSLTGIKFTKKGANGITPGLLGISIKVN